MPKVLFANNKMLVIFLALSLPIVPDLKPHQLWNLITSHSFDTRSTERDNVAVTFVAHSDDILNNIYA